MTGFLAGVAFAAVLCLAIGSMASFADVEEPGPVKILTERNAGATCAPSGAGIRNIRQALAVCAIAVRTGSYSRRS